MNRLLDKIVLEAFVFGLFVASVIFAIGVTIYVWIATGSVF